MVSLPVLRSAHVILRPFGLLRVNSAKNLVGNLGHGPHRHSGFTLIEMLLAVGVIGLVLPVLAVSIQQIVFETNRNNDRITALRPLENTARNLGQDIPLAQKAEPDSDFTVPEGDFLDKPELWLQWTDWTDADQYDTYGETEATYKRSEVSYSLSGTDLLRQQRVCDNWNLTTSTCGGTWSAPNTSTVARNVTSIQFSRDADLFTIDVTSALGGSANVTEKRTLKVYGSLLASVAPL